MIEILLDLSLTLLFLHDEQQTALLGQVVKEAQRLQFSPSQHILKAFVKKLKYGYSFKTLMIYYSAIKIKIAINVCY